MPSGYERLPQINEDAVDEELGQREQCQEDNAGIFSKMLFAWVTPMVHTGYKRPLNVEDLLVPRQQDLADRLSDDWEKQWQTEMAEAKTWNVHLGKRVEDDDGNPGTLKWIGRLQYSSNPQSLYAGVSWDKPRRKVLKKGVTIGGDGYFYGEKVFDCPEGHGSFIKPHLLQIKDAPGVKPPVTPWTMRCVWHVFGWELISAGLFKLGNDLSQFAGPIALQLIVKFLSKSDPTWGEGLSIVAVLFVLQVVQSLCANQYFFMVIRSGMRIRQTLCCAVFEKALDLNERTRANPDLNVGRIVNLMSTDAQRGQDVVQNLHQCWSAPTQILICCVLLYRLVGVALFAGLGVMVITSPLQTKLVRKMTGMREQMVKSTDDRVKAVTEALGGIRIVKFMAWTERFLAQINDIRHEEIAKLARQQNYRVVMFVIIYLNPLLLTATTFIVYSAMGGKIDADTVFPSIALFSIVRFPFTVLPLQFNTMVNAKISFDRLSIYFESAPQKEAGTVVHPLATAPTRDDKFDTAFSIKGTFTAWEPQVVPDLPVSKQQLADPFMPVAGNVQELADGAPEGKTSSKAKKPKGKAARRPAKHKVVPKAVLRDLDVQIRRKKLTMIIGLTGSGKTCLLEALLGSIDGEPGSEVRRSGMTVDGKFCPEDVAYAPQQAWIMNATLKENVTFFTPEDDEKYDRIISSCQLVKDIEQLQDGDQTEIGEKGINLSGGQKQRTSIARAVYSERDMIMLDDPLSAVDSFVAKELMRQVIGSTPLTKPADWGRAELDGCTRVLVTHQLQYVKHADDVIFMKDGRVAAFFRGTDEAKVVDQVLAYTGEGAEFFKPLHEQAANETDTEESTVSTPSMTPTLPKTSRDSAGTRSKTPPLVGPSTAGRLVTTEERARGSVKAHMYVAYVKAAGGWGLLGLTLFFFVFQQTLVQSCDLWLTWWTDSVDSKDPTNTDDKGAPIGNDLSNSQHLLVYVGLIFLAAIITFLRGITIYRRFQTASRNFHEKLTANVMRAPMSFFDTTPLGRLINRFSKDIDQVDVVLPPTIVTFFQLTLSCLATLAVLAASQPLILILMFPAAIVYFRILRMFSRSNRETKRLDSISKSPIFQHFTETLTGIKTITAYGVIPCFRAESRRRIDMNTKTTYSNFSCNRWLAIRLEFLGNFICCSAALLAVVTKLALSGANDSSVGLMSLGIAYAMNLTGQLNFLVRQVADLEAQMNGVERIVEFTEDIDQEPRLQYEGEQPCPPFRGKQYLRISDDRMAIVRSVTDPTHVTMFFPDEDKTEEVDLNATQYSRALAAPLDPLWPRKAEIILEDVYFRYRPGLPLVLKGIGKPPLVIQEKEKVGIVGRTGAGKSSLMLALFRFVELAGGRITIDGRDIRTVDVQDLRKRISMIPQDPVLFQGTVRSNVDPFNEHDDKTLWERIKHVNMYDRLKSHDGELNGMVTEGGQNFSVGQRQLLCMARALLKSNSKILLMDEATASIDHETDMAIQITVREQFKDYTVLTVAHRLQTIMDSTRVMVLDQGLCPEYDTPANLLRDSSSILHDMAQKSGDFDRLLAIAEGRMNIVEAMAEMATQCCVGAWTLVLLAATVAARKAAARHLA